MLGVFMVYLWFMILLWVTVHLWLMVHLWFMVYIRFFLYMHIKHLWLGDWVESGCIGGRSSRHQISGERVKVSGNANANRGVSRVLQASSV